MDLPFYLINLDRSPHRLRMAEAEFRRLGRTFIRVSAVDGGAVPPEMQSWYSQELAVREGNLRLIPGKIGCHLSHLKVARLFLDSGAAAAVVCEDDVRFEPHFNAVLPEVLAAAQDWDLIRLSSVTWHFAIPRACLPCGARLVEFVRVPGGTACYLISRRGAEKLVRRGLPVALPFDRSLQRLWVYETVILGLDRCLAHGRNDIPSEITGGAGEDWWQDEKERRKREIGVLRYAARRHALNAATYLRSLNWSARRHGWPRVLTGALGDVFRYPVRRRLHHAMHPPLPRIRRSAAPAQQK